MAGGDVDGETSGQGEESNQGVVDEVTMTPILQDDGQPVHELVETAKPLKKCTKQSRERDDVTSKVLSILEKDNEYEDEVTLTLASIGKRIKKSLKDEQVDAVLDELNEVVGHHLRSARSGGVIGQRLDTTVHQTAQMQAQPQMQPPPPQHQQSNNYQLMPPALQRMDIAYDPMSNNSYQNL